MNEFILGFISILIGILLGLILTADRIKPKTLQEACTQTKMFIHGQDIYQCQLVVRDGRPL